MKCIELTRDSAQGRIQFQQETPFFRTHKISHQLTMSAKKIVIKADLVGKACMSDILSVVATLQGIKSMDIDADKCTLTVVGAVDPVRIVQKLKKKCFAANIISVADDKKPKEEEKKDPCKEACEKLCKERCGRIACCKECKEKCEKVCKERCERRCKAWLESGSCCRPTPGCCCRRCAVPSYYPYSYYYGYPPYSGCGSGSRWPWPYGC